MGGAMLHRFGLHNPSSFKIISYVGGVTAAFENTTTPNLDLTALTGGSGSAAQENDWVFAYMTICDSVADATDPTISSGGYTALHAVLHGNDLYSTKLRGWRKLMGASPDTIVDFGNMSGDQSGVVQARVYRNVDPTTPLDVAVQTATGVATGQPNPPAVTPVTTGAWVVMAAAAAFDNNLTSAEVIRELDAYAGATGGHSGAGLLMGDVAWTSGAVNPTTSGGSADGNGSWAAATFALRPALA